MENPRALDLHGILDHGNPDAVIRSVRTTYLAAYPSADFSQINEAFSLTHDLYSGRFPGYAACRTGYHDYRHTIDVFVAAVRLLDGAALSARRLSESFAEDVLIAALLHDCGYIQEIGNEEGTGARYTKTHVVRSAAFVQTHAAAFRLSSTRAANVAAIILGTDLAIPWDSLKFDDPDGKTATAVLAAADLLGQMADRAYLEKLLFLYYEFREAGIGGYKTAFDVLRKTATFYESIVARLEGSLVVVSHDARVHFAVRCGEDRDLYREAIDKQMSYLSAIMKDDSVNFRKRLRRVDLEQVERAESSRLKALGVVFA
ncbi:MAG: HD domain-containing protein [Treponemataceae bacterium]